MIQRLDSFRLKDLKMVHGIMEKFLEIEAGEFRNGDECIFVAPPPHLVLDLMTDLFSWMKKNKNKVHPLIMSAVFHYEFVFIHLFFGWKWENSSVMAYSHFISMELAI